MTPTTASDRDFYRTVFHVALPIAMQQLAMNALNAVDVFMIGQKGDTAVAAVGLGNQVYFLLSLYLFGVGSGAAVFSAQFWGQGDRVNVRRVLGLALALGLAGDAIFTAVALAAPQWVLSLYTSDAAVIALGARYLRVVALGYLPIAVTVMYGMILRSTRQVRVPMAITVAALSFKTLLAYGLIFGVAGLPEMGVVGAALATCLARWLECLAMITVTYAARLPTAARLHEMVGLSPVFLRRFVTTSLPVVLSETLWSLGITTYTAIYAHIGTDSIAAVNIASTLENVALVPFFGLGNACAIILGNAIGAGDALTADCYARRFLKLTVLGALGVGVLIALGAGPLLNYYQISPAAQAAAHSVLFVTAGALWLKSANMIIIVGVLRSGGDTRFGLLVDAGSLWLLGMPMAVLGGLVLHLPVYWVIVMVLLGDECSKFAVGLWRVLSRRWINNVVTVG